jgi:hypothetical protein
VTKLRTGIPEVRFSTGSKMKLFSKPTTPSIGPTQPLIQWVAEGGGGEVYIGNELILAKSNQTHMKSKLRMSGFYHHFPIRLHEEHNKYATFTLTSVITRQERKNYQGIPSD